MKSDQGCSSILLYFETWWCLIFGNGNRSKKETNSMPYNNIKNRVIWNFTEMMA
jgi:hypothetical protein